MVLLGTECPVCGGPRYVLGDPQKLYCQTCIIRHIRVRREAGLSPYHLDRKPTSGVKKGTKPVK